MSRARLVKEGTKDARIAAVDFNAAVRPLMAAKERWSDE
jgi:hypothetical protein